LSENVQDCPLQVEPQFPQGTFDTISQRLQTGGDTAMLNISKIRIMVRIIERYAKVALRPPRDLKAANLGE
jgi:hypothetical protein